ncbi:MAG: hypothetical protein LC105_04455 [Chitinophagales bacterium]|nr:hypothetical protein [Chitinophagales bacterium]
MKKHLLLTIISVLLTGVLELHGQVKKSTNIAFGGSYLGGQYTKVVYKPEEQKYKAKILYQNYYNAHAAIEKLYGGKGFLIEAKYAGSKFNTVENERLLIDVVEDYDPDKNDKKINTYSTHVYSVWTIRPQKRVQIPVYLGAGMDYVKGESINQLYVSLAAKLRVKVYVSSRVALYAGYAYETGTDMSGDKSKITYKNNTYHGDFGLIIGVNKKQGNE